MSKVYRVGINYSENFWHFTKVLIYEYINQVMKYWAPNINKCIVNLWELIAYLESTHS